jgi:hypothetical protein
MQVLMRAGFRVKPEAIQKANEDALASTTPDRLKQGSPSQAFQPAPASSLQRRNAFRRPSAQNAPASSASNSRLTDLADGNENAQISHPASLTPGGRLNAAQVATSTRTEAPIAAEFKPPVELKPTLNLTPGTAAPGMVSLDHSQPTLFKNLQPMDRRWAGEETGQVWGTKVAYLNETQRAQHKVTIQNGLVLDSQGRPFDTRTAQTAFDKNKGRAIFVMDHNGDMYISNYQARGKFHHSSFLSGAPVAAAGDIRIEDGVVKTISRKSGHYKPTSDQLGQFAQRLHSQGVNSGFNIDEDLS